MSKDYEEFFDYGYNSKEEESDEQQSATYTELSYQELSDLCKEVKETIKQVTRYVREKAGQDNGKDFSGLNSERGSTVPGRGILEQGQKNRGRRASEVQDSEWDLLDTLSQEANKNRRKRRG